MIKAVIFDLDGVIIDSHGKVNRLFTQVVNEDLGLGITEKEFARFPGLRFEQRIAMLAKDKKKEVPWGKVLETTIRGRDIYFSDPSLEVFPGAVGLFDELKNNRIKIALGSNGGREVILKMLNHLGLTSYFDSIVTFDDVKNGKPSPEMFLKNAKELDVKPEECVVIEDAVTGVGAAKAAGMKAIAVKTTEKEEELSEADIIVDTIQDVTIEMIKSL